MRGHELINAKRFNLGHAQRWRRTLTDVRRFKIVARPALSVRGFPGGLLRVRKRFLLGGSPYGRADAGEVMRASSEGGTSKRGRVRPRLPTRHYPAFRAFSTRNYFSNEGPMKP